MGMLYRLPKYRLGDEVVGALRVDGLEVQKWNQRCVLLFNAHRPIVVAYATYFADKPTPGWYLIERQDGSLGFYPPYPFEVKSRPEVAA